MKALKYLAILFLFGVCFVAFERAEANTQYYRQYYGGWNYYPQYRYYYRYYYYKPYYSYSGYRRHYCIYYPSRPRYYYYYNPYKRVYWGRFDTQGKEGAHYSTLAEEDRKGKLSEIDEGAFPKPGAMPGIPESEDGATIDPPPTDDLPEDTGP